MKQAKLYLIRHGVTAWNREGKYLGHTDEPILEESFPVIDQLQPVVDVIGNPVITSSDLLRCRQTAERLFHSEAIHFDSRLREMQFGTWEGKTKTDLSGDPAFETWLNDYPLSLIPEGEGAEAFSSRVLGWWQEYTSRADFETSPHVVVAHGGVIRVLMIHLTGGKLGDFWDWNVPHGTAFQLYLKETPSGWQAQGWSRLP